MSVFSSMSEMNCEENRVEVVLKCVEMFNRSWDASFERTIQSFGAMAESVKELFMSG